jgi:Matrixin
VKGDVVVALSDARLNSFTFGWPVVQKVVAAIQRNRTYPLMVPNGARNVIAHELGHVIGLRHGDDAGSLMCSRAACHWPFPSEGFFPLTAIEKEKLLEMYPRGWQTAATQRHIVPSTKRR